MVSSLVQFDVCEERQCVYLSIFSDIVGENFTLTLARTEDLDDRISLTPVTGMVLIDYDYGKLFYRISTS